MDALDGVFVDFFAGSGALGLEALSRGASHATFLDTDPRTLEIVTANVETLGFGHRATVRRADSMQGPGTITGDVALCDPPYGFDAWPTLLASLAEAGFAVVVIESDREIDPGTGWATSKQRRYAGTVVTIARRESSAVD
jgi:16S rRNA (guanine966-N2)-methyltransferase